MWRDNETMSGTNERLERISDHLTEIHGDLDLATCTRCGEQVNYMVDITKLHYQGRIELVRACYCTTKAFLNEDEERKPAEVSPQYPAMLRHLAGVRKSIREQLHNPADDAFEEADDISLAAAVNHIDKAMWQIISCMVGQPNAHKEAAKWGLTND